MDIKLNLVTQSPVSFSGFIIHQPSFAEIEQIGIDEFNQFLLPYSITVDLLDIPDEEKIKINLFEQVIMRDKMLFDSLIISLQYFCKTSEINIVGNEIHIDNGILNKNNFNELGDIILKMCSRERIKIEKPPKFENERQRDCWEKLQEGRKRDAKRNELHLYDVLNVCEFYDYYIPMSIIKTWTLYKIMQCYKVKMGVSNYRDGFSIYLVSGEKSFVEEKNHWTNQIKVS